ncbi:MAG: hypothetical protein K6G00_10385 [Treponema sp.]|nr:hypothetical protein [Treponema sp.]
MLNKLKRLLLIVCLALTFSQSCPAQESKAGTVITINNARKTEYQKDDDTGDELIVMTGNVSMTVSDNENDTDIKANKIRYNRKTNMLFAEGNVRLVQKGKDGAVKQDITAKTLLLNTSSMEGVFDNSRIVKIESGKVTASSTIVVTSKLTGKTSSGAMAFKNATVTFCKEENPHWKIRATKMWMLAGGEFAFLNAALYVGNVPVLYLPAFYYPKDELIFNPVIGYDNRKGWYFQTTTYLYGRKPLEDDSAKSSKSSDDDDDDDISFSFAHQTTLKEQRREGVVLHNLDKDFTGSTDDYLKLTADAYSMFGGLVGIDGSFSPDKYISKISGFFDLGFSNTVFYRKDKFSRYSYLNKIFYDRTNFLGNSFPFRFAGNFSMTVKEPFRLQLDFPLYSDPYFITDFGNRKETMDWIGFLTSSSEVTDEQKNTDDSDKKVTTYTWKAEGSYSMPVKTESPSIINKIDVNKVSSSVIFNSKKRTDKDFTEESFDWQSYSPERMFFYPSQVTPFEFSMEIGGTFYEFRSSPEKEPEFVYDEESYESNDQREFDFLFEAKDLPDLDGEKLPSVTAIEGLYYSLGYSIKPSYVSQFTYNSSQFEQGSDFKWSNMYSSYYVVTSPVSLISKVSYRKSFISMTNTLTFDPSYQMHPSLDGYTTQASKNSVIESDYDSKKLDLIEQNVISFRPFAYDSLFKNTGIDWSTKVKLLRTKFIGDADNPEWEYLTGDLTDRESMTENLITGYLSATEGKNYSQTVTLSASLPPLNDERDAKVSFIFPFAKLNFSTGVILDENRETWTDKPLRQSASVYTESGMTLTESFNYNLEKDYADSMKLSATFKGFQLAYVMQHTYGYDYDEVNGWVSQKNQYFQPYTMSLSYVSEKKFHYWKNRISFSPGVDTSLVYDFIKPTESYMVFIPSVTFRINEFLDIKFSSESRNSVIFRYVQGATTYGNIVGGETNVMQDLIDSFAFWDTSLKTRKKSGFKLKKLKIDINHNLCDWDLTSSFIFQPRLINEGSSKPYYSYEPYFSFAITWKPMTGIRTKVVDEYGEYQLNP